MSRSFTRSGTRERGQSRGSSILGSSLARAVPLPHNVTCESELAGTSACRERVTSNPHLVTYRQTELER